MDINILSKYINYCNSLNIKPTFKGLREFRDNQLDRPWSFKIRDYNSGLRDYKFYTRR